MSTHGPAPTNPEEYFAGHPEGLEIYLLVLGQARTLGPVTVRTTRSQVALRRRRGFAFLWRPGQYVRSTVPVVLSLALDHEIASAKVKEVAHPSPSVWMHHLELNDRADVDDDVRGLMAEAYAAAG